MDTRRAPTHLTPRDPTHARTHAEQGRGRGDAATSASLDGFHRATHHRNSAILPGSRSHSSGPDDSEPKSPRTLIPHSLIAACSVCDLQAHLNSQRGKKPRTPSRKVSHSHSTPSTVTLMQPLSSSPHQSTLDDTSYQRGPSTPMGKLREHLDASIHKIMSITSNRPKKYVHIHPSASMDAKSVWALHVCLHACVGTRALPYQTFISLVWCNSNDDSMSHNEKPLSYAELKAQALHELKGLKLHQLN